MFPTKGLSKDWGSSRCDRSPTTRTGIAELARICEQGGKSTWPSRDPWQNSDAWQNAYLALAAHIADGKVDLDRPLRPLARTTARRFFLTDCRQRGRLSELTDAQLHRFHLGEETSLEDHVEASRRGDALRTAMLGLVGEGSLSEADLAILTRRYVDEWSAKEVAGTMGLGVANVRQICARRRQVLRQALAEQGLARAAHS